MAYDYNIICILESPKVYIEDTLRSESFNSALFSLIESRKIASSVFLIYCRKKQSGDLKLMGKYDGLSVITFRGLRFTHILSTTENKDYSIQSDGFRRIFIR